MAARWGVHALLLAALLATCARAEVFTRDLEEFSGIRTCLPFNLLIKPSKGEYSLTVDSDESIESAIKADVSAGVLELTTKTGFNVSQPIKVWVSLPSDKLENIVKSAAADVVVQQGFKVKELDVLVNGLGQMIIYDIRVDDLVLESTEIGNFVVDGKIKRARVSGVDTSRIYLKGVVNSVEASLSGVSKLYIVSSSRNLLVTGRAKSLSRVYLSKGRCNVRGDFAFRRSCILSKVTFPTKNPLYSCGLLADGELTCSSESATSTSFLSTGSTSTSAFASSRSSFASAFSTSSVTSRGSSARSSSRVSFGRGNFDTLITRRASASARSSSGSSVSTSSSVSTGRSGYGSSRSRIPSEDEAEAVAVVSTQCDVEDAADLNMF